MRTTLTRPCGCSKKHIRGNAVKNQSQTMSDDSCKQEEFTTPLVDIVENDNEFIIFADMPGVSEETIDVKYNDGELCISGNAVDEKDLEDVTFRCYQFDPGNYFRNFRIGESINSDAITADYADGVLTVHLPKREEIQPRKIAVNKQAQA
ncbi:MAG: Hsp20/alpha crystallin family protein [Planctomycetia bacterium]|nr:Hsp20/alpha crystallin family protein [Planctomycetia bacterium]